MIDRFSSLISNKGTIYMIDKELGRGGEGSVYTLINQDEIVAKIYHPTQRSPQREIKLKKLLSKGWDIKVAKNVHIALPIDILYSNSGKFMGYTMPKIEGKSIKTALFSPKRISSKYPNFRRKDLVYFARHFIKQLDFLHSKNILIGDINPLNILVPDDNPKRGWIIDADSFQVDDMPCPVGTDLFTPPRLQGVSFSNTLRSLEDEYFSMAIMLFMILMLGKHPFSTIGGENPAHNIKNHSFPYPLKGKMDRVPPGLWRYIWSHFNYPIKEAFYEIFVDNKRVDTKKWYQILTKYQGLIEKGYFSDDIVPLSFRTMNPKRVICRDCQREFDMDKSFYIKLQQSNKLPLCSLCMQKIQATILAKKNRQNHSNQQEKYTSYNSSSFIQMIQTIFNGI